MTCGKTRTTYVLPITAMPVQNIAKHRFIQLAGNVVYVRAGRVPGVCYVVPRASAAQRPPASVLATVGKFSNTKQHISWP